MDVKVLNGNEIQFNIKREDITSHINDRKDLKEFLDIYFRLLENKPVGMKLGRLFTRRVRDIVIQDYSHWLTNELDKLE
tara:strand:- start:199 stop:435 length:237 start_codon:yes stop_codon:yes gene_type:complete